MKNMNPTNRHIQAKILCDISMNNHAEKATGKIRKFFSSFFLDMDTNSTNNKVKEKFLTGNFEACPFLVKKLL